MPAVTPMSWDVFARLVRSNAWPKTYDPPEPQMPEQMPGTDPLYVRLAQAQHHLDHAAWTDRRSHVLHIRARTLLIVASVLSALAILNTAWRLIT